MSKNNMDKFKMPQGESMNMSYSPRDAAYGKFFIMPQNKNDYEFLRAVEHKAISEIYRKFGLIIDYEWQANTTANCVVETLITHLAFLLRSEAANGIGIAFYDILKAIVSIKTNEKAEKEGNINIFFEPGSKVAEMIKNGPIEDTNLENPLQMFITGIPEDDDLYHNLEYHSRYNLSSQNGIMMPPNMKFATFAIAYTFFECLYLEILYRLANMDAEEGEEKLVSVNFNDLIEIHGIMKGDAVNITMRPGRTAKLLIKCDEVTEHTMGDLD